MIKNADVTIYNRYKDINTGGYSYNRTVISNVYWESEVKFVDSGTNTRADDRLTLVIPIDYESHKTYVSTNEYADTASLEDLAGLFTISVGDVVKRGICDEEYNQEDGLEGSFTIVGIAENIVGREHMWHWEVSGI